MVTRAPLPRLRRAGQRPLQSRSELGEAGLGRARPHDHEQVERRRRARGDEPLELTTQRLPQPAADAVAHDGLADLAAHDETDPHVAESGRTESDAEVLTATGLPLPQPLERSVAPQGTEHRAARQRSDTLRD
jgi:hypothetical protein